ncbi:hypothetical protein FNX05_27635, partial [Salmonella enterica subsp. enterica serovar Irumu]|nr:hypothetical protein [Salmonella enterica subsp. enterica serovar Irumu]
TIAIGKAVKQTVDTRFYPQVNVCLTSLDSYGFVTPGTTEVHICDGSGHSIPSGSGYSVTSPDLSTSGCPAQGGGVCPSDAPGVKADFTNLTGDDIRALARSTLEFQVHDKYAIQDLTSTFPNGKIAFYGELKTHTGTTDLSASDDLFHTGDAKSYCSSVVGGFPANRDDPGVAASAAQAILKGAVTGGPTSADSVMQTIHMGSIAKGIRTGGDTNPELFVDGISVAEYIGKDGVKTTREYKCPGCTQPMYGTIMPAALAFVNGSRGAATTWTFAYNGPEVWTPDYFTTYGVGIGTQLVNSTGWNLSDTYFVNNWPGTPYTLHKAGNDPVYWYVTQTNYITGYICAARLH